MSKRPRINIGGRWVGEDYSPLVIAEIGINHEGSLATAIEMVDAASRAGVEVVKHQTHIVDDEMSMEARKVIPGNAECSIYEIMERCSLKEEEEIELKSYVESKGMIFLSTPFSRAAAIRLEGMGVEAYKIGSGECNNLPLLEHIANYNKPVILSTGMNDIESIKKAVSIFQKKSIPIALLHTTNLYPTPPNLVRLGALQQLRKEFPELVTGLSDHTTSNHACFAAVALGASILERHFTDHMQRKGPDIVNSMDEESARELIQGANLIWQMRGGVKEAAREEKITSDFAFATVVTTKEVKRGERFDESNIWVKRPGIGEIPAASYAEIIGKKSSRDIASDQHLSWVDVSNE